MVMLIAAVLMLVFAYDGYRTARRALDEAALSENAAVHRPAGALDDVAGPDVRDPESAAEVREAALTRQLFDGELGRDEYQSAMTQLARPNPGQAGGAR